MSEAIRCKHSCCKVSTGQHEGQSHDGTTSARQPEKQSKSDSDVFIIEDDDSSFKNEDGNLEMNILDDLPAHTKESAPIEYDDDILWNDDDDWVQMIDQVMKDVEKQCPERRKGTTIMADDHGVQSAAVKKQTTHIDACDRIWEDVGNFAFEIFNNAGYTNPIEDSDAPLADMVDSSPPQLVPEMSKNDSTSSTNTRGNSTSLSRWLNRYTTVTEADP